MSFVAKGKKAMYKIKTNKHSHSYKNVKFPLNYPTSPCFKDLKLNFDSTGDKLLNESAYLIKMKNDTGTLVSHLLQSSIFITSDTTPKLALLHCITTVK